MAEAKNRLLSVRNLLPLAVAAQLISVNSLKFEATHPMILIRRLTIMDIKISDIKSKIDFCHSHLPLAA